MNRESDHGIGSLPVRLLLEVKAPLSIRGLAKVRGIETPWTEKGRRSPGGGWLSLHRVYRCVGAPIGIGENLFQDRAGIRVLVDKGTGKLHAEVD